MKRNRALTLAGSIGAVMAMTISTAVAAPPTAPRDVTNNCDDSYNHGFSDVTDNNVHADSIRCVKQHGITAGKTATTYYPSGSLTAGQLASFLARTVDAAAGSEGWNWPKDGTGADFDSTNEAHDYYTNDEGSVHEENINKLAHVGVLPTTSTTFNSGATVNRATMSQWTYDALRLYGTLASGAYGGSECFTDDETSNAEDAINYLADAGIVTGRTDGTFGPSLDLRRDQMASFLARAYDAAKDKATTGGEAVTGHCPAS